MPYTTHYRMYINGEWVDSPSVVEIHSPTDGSLVATVAEGDADAVDRAVAAASAAHNSGIWRDRPPAERAAVLDDIADRLEARVDELVTLQVRENGATIRAAASFLVGYSIAHLRYFAGLARTFPFEQLGELLESPTLATGIVRNEPVGVCGAIVPWNFPLLIAVWKLGPALAAGNTMVVKPDEQTPLTLLELVRAADEAGLPAGVLNVVTGPGPTTGARLVEHPDVRKIAFTGSTEVGRQVMRGAADNIKKVTLELGGKGANIVLDDADIDLAVDGALFGFLLLSGQVCLSGTRLLLPASIHDAFVEKLVARIATITMGDPMDIETDIGPLVSLKQKQRVEKYIALGQEEGATVAYQGTTPQDPALASGHWVAPVIFTDVTNDMRIAREEIFGPVLAVIRYEDDEDAVRIANDSEYGLSAGVWSTDNQRALTLARRLDAGTVWINDWHMLDCQHPFGGYKQSGLGRELGPDALREYLEPKLIRVDMTNDRAKRAFSLVVSAPA